MVEEKNSIQALFRVFDELLDILYAKSPRLSTKKAMIALGISEIKKVRE